MLAIPTLLLGLSACLPTSTPPTTSDPARLREMLQDRHHARNQSQAALVLVQAQWAEAKEIVRQGLLQTDSPEVFLSLAAAIRLQRDYRFTQELLDALSSARPKVREAAGETLAVLANADILKRLKALAEDAQADLQARREALWALGRSGLKAAAEILLEQMVNPDEVIRRAASEGLADLSGHNWKLDLPRWRSWWESHKNLSNDIWLEERLAYQASRARRVEGDLARAKAQLVQLHQQYYARLPAADRLSHVQTLVDNEDPAVRTLAVTWASEMLPSTDSVGQRALANLLLSLCRDGNLNVQVSAVQALGGVNDSQVFRRLKALIQRSSPPVQAAAAHALAQQAMMRTQTTNSGPAVDMERIRKVIPLLQQALDEQARSPRPALEVVVAAAESLGSLGAPEAGPVLSALLKHPSPSVRETAAQALERVADPKVMDGLLAALDDPSVKVRFGLVGALGRIAGSGKNLADAQRSRLLARLEELVLRDADPGVRSRAATVLGQYGSATELGFLWRRLLSREDSRVQEKTAAAFAEILARSANLELLRRWDRTMAEAKQPARRVQMLADVHESWKKNEATKALVTPVAEMLIEAHLEQANWQAALPLVREQLAQPGSSSAQLDRRLRWLLTVGEKALAAGNRSEALQAVRDAQPYLARSSLADDFARLEKKIH